MATKLCVRAIIEHDGRLLAVKNAVEGRDFFCLPGGGVEQGESLLEALEREIVEELGVRPVIGRLLYVQQLSNFGGSGERYGLPALIFHVTNGADFMHADFSKATHSFELTAAAFVDPATIALKPYEIADDWQQLVQRHFDQPPKLLISEWQP